MKYTVLDMTQNILSRMSSDEVNSISDSTESLQVANILKNKFYDVINRVDLPEYDQLVQLDPSLDSTQPVLMYIPSNVTELKWLKYFNSDVSGGTPAAGYQYVTLLPIQQFIDMVNQFNTTETNVETFSLSTPETYVFNYKNDRQPSFCTVLSNYYVIFDAFNENVDSTLQGSKCMALGRVTPTFELEDDFIPNLSDEQFQLLVNEATALAFFELKQQPHQLAMQEAKRGWSSIQKDKAVSNRPTSFDALPNFGRVGRGFNSNVSYFKSRGFDK